MPLAVLSLAGAGVLNVLVVLLIGLLVIGVVYWIAAQVLPPPIPVIIALVCVLVLLIALLS